MTNSRLNARVERLQPISTWPMVIYPEPGELEMDVERRAASSPRPVVVAPKPCATTEEWLEAVDHHLGRGRP